MVLNDDLLTFHGEIIHGDPDASGMMLISKQEKYAFQNKLIRHLFEHTDPLTREKNQQPRLSPSELLQTWS
jgi:hypothetical protein